MEYIFVFALAVLVCVSRVMSVPPKACVQCQQSQACKPPECFCCRDDLKIPNLDVSQIPQMVFFTFDDAVTTQVSGFYQELFDSARKNPNGCSISMTLFISHFNTDYRLVSDFYRKGMEIASHSVTHDHMNGTNFLEEAKSQKENLAKLANIPIEEITGWRSPFLKPAGDLQPDALKKLGYTYDATLTFSKRSLRERPPGPFTLDFGYPYECQVKPCPKSRHPGFWEVPVVSLMDYKQLYDCVYVDGCMNAPPDEESAYKFLWENFNNYYTTTRMPFGINMHPSWFFYPDRLRAMDRFIQKLVSMNDVYIISASRMLEWLKRPTPLTELHSFAPWACDGREKKFNSGPRVVKTNLPPPSTAMSWMPRARSNSRDRFTTRTHKMFTPAPVFQQRQYTPTNNRDTFQSNSNSFQTNRIPYRPRLPAQPAPDSFPAPPRFNQRRDNSRSDFSQDLERQQLRIREEILRRQLRQWQLQQRRRQNPMRQTNTNTQNMPTVVQNSSRANNNNANNANADTVQRARKTQREIMEQHEQRLRQHQLLEERQRRMERDRLKKTQQVTLTGQPVSVGPRAPEVPQIPAVPAVVDLPPQHKPDQVVNSVQVFQPKQKHILWHTGMRPDLRPSEARHRGPVKIQQETIKLWPTVAPTRTPTLRPANNIAATRFNGRHGVPVRDNELTRLRNRINRPVSPTIVKPTVNPAIRVVKYTEPPVWYNNFENRFNRFTPDNSLLRRGGSNRRQGIVVEPSAVPVRAGGSFRRTQSVRVRSPNETSSIDQFNDMRQNQLTHSPTQRDFFGQSRPKSISIRDNSLARNRNVLPRRSSMRPSVAQRMAWNNFIRQMFGPH